MGKGLRISALFLLLSLALPVALSFIFTDKAFSNGVHFNDVYVDAVIGSDDLYDGSSPAIMGPGVGPKKTLHGGRDVVNSGGTVHVAASTYNENICFGDNVTLVGAGALSTIIAPYPGDNYEPLLSIATGNPSIHNASTISGFTIQNGSYYGTIYSGNGGGVYVGETSAVTLNDCAIVNNGADCGAGIYNLGTLYMNRCCVSGNSAQYQGGGIFNSSSGLVNLTNCTISGNTGLEIDGCSGGGIYNEGAMAILNCTITYNSVAGVSMSVGGGFADYSTQPMTFKNTIVANNHAGNDHYNNGWSDGNDGRIITTSLGYNIDSENSCSFNQSTDKINTDPLLGLLQNNDGSTSTHAITIASPAYNSGTNNGAPATDQRGVVRPQARAYDIGAFELVPPAPPPPPPPVEPPYTGIGTGSSDGSSGSISSTFSQMQTVVNPTFIIQGASISLSQTSGEPVTINATVSNTSTVNGVTKVKLYINGQLDSEQAVTVASGRQMPISFSVSRNEPGTYQVYVNGTSAGSFTVSDNSTILYVSIGCLFLAFVLGVILIYRRFTV